MKVQVDDGGVYVDMGSTELLSVPYALFAEEGNEGPAGPPGDPATDDQILSINGHDLTISGGNMVSLPDSVIDDDADPINDSTILHKTLLRLSGGEHDKLFITNKNAVTIIDEEIWFVKKVILFAPEESILIKNNRIVIDICLYLAYNLNVET